MDMIGKELKIIKSGKVYGVPVSRFVSRRPKTSKVKKFVLNMDRNSTLDV